MRAARRRRLRRGAHGDAGRQRRDGRLVVRLAPARRRCATGSGTRAAHVSQLGRAARGRAGAKAHWGTVHHPVEDVGTGRRPRADRVRRRRARSASRRDALDDPRVATIVCGYAGDDTLRVRHTPMVHVFLRRRRRRRAAQPLLARRRAAPLRAGAARGAGGAAARQRASSAGARCRAGLPRALARHCAEEYANLAALLPELYERFGPKASPQR